MYELDKNVKYRSSFVFSVNALRQNLRLRPIGVREVLRCMASKVTVSLLKEDVTETTGSLQVCVGQGAEIEAAIHSMKCTIQKKRMQFLLDVKNAFNSVNKSFFAPLTISLSFYLNICENFLQSTIKGCFS